MALQIEVKSNSRQARSDLAKLNRSVDKIATNTSAMGDKLQRSIAIIGTGIAGILAGKAITNITDSYRRLEARIALTNDRVEDQVRAFKAINKIAIETRSSQESLADLYSRIGRATKQLGVEQATVIQITRSIAQAITISGSSAESANSAIVQLGQGLAAGALRGQELNSVMEQTPAVAQAIARGMGITIGQLRTFANEGKLTANAVVDALKDQGAAIDAEFARVPLTFAQGLLVLSTGVGRVVNEVDQVFGATQKLSAGAQSLGIRLNNTAKSIADSVSLTSGKLGGLVDALSLLIKQIGMVADSFLFLGKVIVERALPTNVILAFKSFVNNLRSVFLIVTRLALPFARLGYFLETTALNIDLLARALRIGPLERFSRAITFGVFDALSGFQTKVTEVTTAYARASIIWSKSTALIFVRGEFAIKRFGLAFGRLGAELGGPLGFILKSLNVFSKAVASVFGFSAKVLAAPFFEIIALQFAGLTRIVTGFGSKIALAFSEGLVNGIAFGVRVKSGDLASLFEDIVNAVRFDDAKLLVQDVVNIFKDLGLVFRILFGNPLKDFASSTADLGESLRSVGLSLLGVFSSSAKAVSSPLDSIQTAFEKFGQILGIISEEGKQASIAGLGFAISLLISPVASVTGLVATLAIVFAALASTVIVSFIPNMYRAITTADSLAEAFDQTITVFKNLGKEITRVAKTVLLGGTSYIADFGKIVINIFKRIYTEVIGNSWWTDTIEGIVSSVKLLKKPQRAIQDFAKRVIGFFKDAYIAIIGNSWWTDTIDGIVEKTKLLNGVKGRIAAFASEVIKNFRDIDSVVRLGLTIGFGLLATSISATLGLVVTAVSAFGVAINSGAISLSELTSFSRNAISSMRELTNEFDLLVDGISFAKNAMSSISDAGVFNNIISGLQGIRELILPLGTLLRDTFGSSIESIAALVLASLLLPFKTLAILGSLLLREELTGAINTVFSLFGTNIDEVLNGFGQIGGRIAASIVKAIPQIVGLLGEIANGFVNGFLDSFGIIGDAIRGLFNLIDTLTLGLLSSFGGVAGAGILGLILLGTKPMSIVKSIGGIIGNIHSVVTTGMLLNKKGAWSTYLFGVKGGAGLLGRTKQTLAPVFDFLLSGVTGLTNSLAKSVIYGEGFFSLFSIAKFKEMASGFTLVGLQSWYANFSFIATAASAKAMAASFLLSVKAVLAQTFAMGRLILVQTALAALTTVLSISFGVLTATLALVATAARAMWVALSGPLAPFVLAFFGLMALFSSFGAKASDDMEGFAKTTKSATKEVEGLAKGLTNGQAQAGSLRNTIANFVGMGVNLDVNFEFEPKSIDEVFDYVKKGNEELLYDLERDTGSLRFDWENDLYTWLELGFRDVVKSFLNDVKDVTNSALSFTNILFDLDLKMFKKDTKSAIDDVLDAKYPGLKIELDVNRKDLEKFTTADDRGMFVKTSKDLVEVRRQIREATQDTFLWFDADWAVDQNALKDLNGDLVFHESLLKHVTAAMKRQVNAGKYISGFSKEWTNVNTRLTESGALFGGQIITTKGLLDISKLNSKEQERYKALSMQAFRIAGNIKDISGDTALTAAERSNQVAKEAAGLEEVNYQLQQVGVKLAKLSNFDLMRAIGLDDSVSSKLGDEERAKVIKHQKLVMATEKAIAELKRQDAPLANINAAEAQLVQLESQSSGIAKEAERSLLTMFDKISMDLGESKVSLDLEEFIKLPKDLQSRVTKFSSQMKALDDAIARTDNKEALAALQIGRAQVEDQIATALNVDIDTSQLDNFALALKPFRDLGINFDTDTFSDLGKTFSDKIIQQATDLNEEREEIANTAYKLDSDRLKAVADFNRKLFDLEEATRKAREDALLSDKTSEELANGFGSAIMGAMTGKSDFGDSMASLITNKLEMGLEKRIASFAEGFMDAFFSIFEGQDGFMGSLADALKGPSNSDGDSTMSAGGDLFGSLFGGGKESEATGDGSSIGDYTSIDLSGGGVGEAIEKGVDTGAASIGKVLDGWLPGLGGMFDSLTNGLGGIFSNLTSSLGSILSNLMGGSGGGSGILGSLFSLGVSAIGGGAASAASAATSGANALGGLSFGGTFNDGGMVTSTGLANVHADEMILNKRQQSNLFNQLQERNKGQSANQQQISINVTGDISRQTKKEIYSMMPTIAQGVNQQNREQNR